ncbi:DUF3137 domain-containing protein [Muricauda oceani]|uniref:DUF3137 domain-containing protein n=1 Tax=Flagellimonas oceani TaxID=2698672 RepID=A0A6G7J417_9FLAO|nr:DUF3137 domain-containing protein [Allomuricauda oceani]MBW8242738.1 DUF3137 domain-containing protein [Allomuricauda oceani]QII45526.1 DUF3137 domain-containing protein [Allomuricauda oceani]
MIDYKKIQEELHPLLVKAEHVRKKHFFFQKGFSVMVVVIILGFLLIPIMTFINNAGFSRWIANTTQGKSFGTVQLLMAFYWLPFFIFMIGSYSYKNKFKSYERKIMKIALDKMLPEFKFDPRKQISAEQIEESKLLPSYFQVGKKRSQRGAHNLHFGTLSGKVGQTSISMGDVNIINQGFYGSVLMYIPLLPYFYMVYNYIRPWFSKHHSTENLGSNFVGMFAVVDFNKNFNGHTIILPDVMEKRVGYLAKNLQTMNMSRGQLVHLEDTDFENDFMVYSTDQVEARYILSTSLMERITQLKRKVDKPIMLSLNKNKLYLGVQHPQGFLCLNKEKNLLTEDIFEKIHEDIKTAIGIVEDLNLNTRIWKNESAEVSK